MILCPKEMELEALAKQDCEPLGFELLVGCFRAYRFKYIDRPSLVEAIRCWQITEAKARIAV